MTGKENVRVDCLDQLKGFGIILVVIGHFIEPYRTVPIVNSIFIGIYTFHMPLFCLMSGIVAKFNIRKIYYKMLWIYISSQSLYLLCYVAVNDGVCGGGVKHFLRRLIFPYWHMWYLFALIIWLMLLPIIKKIEQYVPRFVIVLGYIGIALCSGYIRLPFDLTRVVAFYIFFLIGYLYKDELFKWLREEKDKFCYMFCSITLIVALSTAMIAAQKINAEVLWGYQSYFDGRYTLQERAIYYISAMIICICWCCLSSQHKNTLLSQIGRETLPVYIFHAVFVKVVNIFDTAENLGSDFLDIYIRVIIRLIIAVTVIIFLQAKMVVCNVNKVWNVWIKRQRQESG